MRAMVLKKVRKPLQMEEIAIPTPHKNQILLKVFACGVCRTDLHIIDGELPHPKLPLILGHQIVGRVESLGLDVSRFKIGDRVGVPWLAFSCGKCPFCLSAKENLCNDALFTGYHVNGGFAEYAIANADYAFLLPTSYSDEAIAPLLCGGLIGFRAWQMIANAQNIGFYGFGSSAHILTFLARLQSKSIYVFTKKGDLQKQMFAKQCGAIWAGSIEDTPPLLLDAAIIFAPDGKLVPIALQTLQKGGSIICAGIHMSNIPSFPYSLLWEERSIHSVANLTRKDGEEFLKIAGQTIISPQVTCYPLNLANEALNDLKKGKVVGSIVLRMH